MASNDVDEDSGSYDLAEDALPIPAQVTQGSTPAPAAPGAGICAVCRNPIANEYYMLGTARVCPNCRITAGGGTAGGFVRFLKATALGIGGGLIGAAVWFGVRRASGYEIGLVAILVGFLVGFGVLVGSGRRGGRGYQFLALGLTYLAIAINYAPDVYGEIAKGAREHQTTQGTQGGDTGAESIVQTIVVVVLTVPITFAAPVLSGFSNPISFLIAGFALWEAWKINRLKSTFTGPFGGAVGLPPPIRR